jgi:DNA-binding HxlR family transcriptional regulator
MTAIKESSTRNMNKSISVLECPVSYVLERIGGHWKPIVLYHLLPGPKRYSELKKSIPTITEKVLIQQLKQLENDGIINREARPVVPPFVTYSLTESGRALEPVLKAMCIWAMKDSKKVPVDPYGILDAV